MKQLLILSGKGGTGKTTVASAFIQISNAKAFADCDVDAPNLHLIKRDFDQQDHWDYFGMDKAVINPSVCTDCGLCQTHCRFDAISHKINYVVDTMACEGCGVCERMCPANAIEMQRAKAGDLQVFKGMTTFSTAKLKMGSGTSGMLVTEVKKKLKAATEGVEDVDFAIIDGSPGIGCPVISSISGVDMVLIVAEPSVSGISDMKRIVETAQIFQPRIAVCINKYDTNVGLSEKIEAYCEEKALDFVGKIPFDSKVVKAVNAGLSIAEVDCAARTAVEIVYRASMKIFLAEDNTLFKINRG
ncbi:nucleotide-binding protein [Fusibacter ferrireducens]|uniref:ATP-binding protein n=1 Tax=Fusibacter ferrireducens TaxID=2785058 RepID=A0ABR9ZSH6_9FIRM|nr:ATP-binding protein [Fusibacter ferrireducens]MBF4693418.1 ATP-binding protein [Fusibacter ferrireducens]